MALATDYHIRPYRADDEISVVSLLCRRFAGWRDYDDPLGMFRWKHIRNPFGESLMSVVEWHGEIVAFRAFMRWEIESFDGRERVSLVRGSDAVTDADHVRRGLWRAMTVRDTDRATGVADLAIAHGNERSRAGYLKLGWHHFGAMIPVVTPGRLVRRLSARHTARTGECPGWLELSSGGFERWTEGGDGRWKTVFTQDFIEWRYGELPLKQQHCLPFRLEDSGHPGLVVGSVRERGRVREFRLTDVFVAAKRRDPLRSAIAACRTLDVDVITRSTSRRLRPWEVIRGPGLPIRARQTEVLAKPLANASSPPPWDELDLNLCDMETYF